MRSGDVVVAKTLPGEDDDVQEVSGTLQIVEVVLPKYTQYLVDGRNVDPKTVKKRSRRGKLGKSFRHRGLVER